MAPRICFVSSHAQLGGAESYLTTVCRALGEDRVAGIISLQDGPLVPRLEHLGMRVQIFDVPGAPIDVLRSTRRLRSLVASTSADVVHANGIKAAAMLSLVKAPKPVVWLKHDFSFDGRLAEFVARRSSLVVGVSHAVVQGFSSRLRSKIRVVSPGLDRESPGRAVGKETVGSLVPGGGPTVIMVGRVHPVKGQLEIVEALPGILRRHPETTLLLVGGADPSTPTYLDFVSRRVEELGLASSVLFTHHRDDVPALIAGSDLGVVPSIAWRRFGRESFSLAALEMMAAGIPVVGYDHGGLPEALGECGVLVPEGDRQALGDAIGDLLDDRTLTEQLGSCGRDRAKDHFSTAAMIAGLERCYAEVAM